MSQQWEERRVAFRDWMRAYDDSASKNLSKANKVPKVKWSCIHDIVISYELLSQYFAGEINITLKARPFESSEVRDFVISDIGESRK